MVFNAGVGIILYDLDNGYLLHLRDDKPGISCPGQWAYFSGGVEKYDRSFSLLETALTAAKREMSEEVRLELNLLFFYKDFIPRINLHRFFFFNFIHGIIPSEIDLREGQKVDYFTIDKFPDNMHPSVRKIFVRHSIMYGSSTSQLSLQNSNPIRDKMR